MKRKIWGLLIIVLTVVTATGCGIHRKAKSSATNIKTEYYQDLSKHDRQNNNFKFKAIEDESTSGDQTNYLVDMTIKNNSRKNIKFDLSKFVMLNPYDSNTKVTSNKKKVITVKAEFI